MLDEAVEMLDHLSLICLELEMEVVQYLIVQGSGDVEWVSNVLYGAPITTNWGSVTLTNLFVQLPPRHQKARAATERVVKRYCLN